MGLQAMGNLPNWEEQMRVSNNMGHGAHLAPMAWTGEASLGSLGLADNDIAGLAEDGSDKAINIINALSNTATNLASAFQKNKKSKARPMAAPQPQMQPYQGGGAGGGGGGGGFMGIENTTWLMIGGGVLVLGAIIFMVSKKKKSDKGGE